MCVIDPRNLGKKDTWVGSGHLPSRHSPSIITSPFRGTSHSVGQTWGCHMNWFVACLKPGAGKVAPARIDLLLEFERYNETIAERSVRDAGFAAYTPRYKRELTHHRTKKRIERAFPLFHGYLFVELPLANAELLKDCDGIRGVLGAGEGCKIWPVNDVVARLQQEENSHLFDDTPAGRQARQEEARTRKGTARMKFPKGVTIWVKEGGVVSNAFAGHHGQVVGATTRGTIRATLNLLGRLVPVEFEQDEIELAA